jgi:lipopolysaccharide transport system permease protein
LQVIAGIPPGLAYLFIPVAIVLHLVFVSGIGLFLSALNVFIRDTALALPNILTLVLFSSPIFYPLKVYPHFLQPYLSLNPFYVIAACYRAPIVDGTLPPLWMPIYLAVLSALLFVGGLIWFRRLKTFFDTRL